MPFLFVCSLMGEAVQRFLFPGEDESFCDVSVSEIKAMEDGKMFFVRVVKNDSSRIGCCTKTPGVLYVSFSNAEIETIEYLREDLGCKIQILDTARTAEEPIIVFESPVSLQAHTVLSRCHDSSNIDIYVISEIGRCCVIHVQSKNRILCILASTGFPAPIRRSITLKHDKYVLMVTDITSCEISMHLQAQEEIFQWNFDISFLSDGQQEKRDMLSLSRRLLYPGHLVANLVDSFTKSI